MWAQMGALSTPEPSTCELWGGLNYLKPAGPSENMAKSYLLDYPR